MARKKETVKDRFFTDKMGREVFTFQADVRDDVQQGRRNKLIGKVYRPLSSRKGHYLGRALSGSPIRYI